MRDNLLPEKIVVCVCTYRRPVLLASCLASLGNLKQPPGMEVEIIVVDNELFPVHRMAVHSARETSRYAVIYVHEPVKGIARARNAALDAAKTAGADWIAFIDDDERADENWLLGLMADQYRNVPILAGWQHMVYPRPRPFWCLERNRPPVEGVKRQAVTTSNVRFSTTLLEAGLRFNEDLGDMGGEDTEFFTAARLAGFEIRQTARAVTLEAVHAERMTYLGQVYRAYWAAAARTRCLALEFSWRHVLLFKSWTAPLSILLGVAEILISPLLLPIDLHQFKKRCLGGGKKIARGAGRAAAIAGIMPRPYRRIHGE